MPDTVNNHPTDHGNTNSIDRFLNVVEAEKQGHDKLKSWLNVRALDIVLKRLTKEMDSARVPDVYKRPHPNFSWDSSSNRRSPKSTVYSFGRK